MFYSYFTKILKLNFYHKIKSKNATYEKLILDEQSKYPKFIATCFCSRYDKLKILQLEHLKYLFKFLRKPGYYLKNAFFLIFLITASALTIFSIDCKLPQSRLQTVYTLLLTSVSFKWVVNRSLPTVSYLTSLDKYAITCIVFISLTAFWHSIVGSSWTTIDAR